MKKQIVFLLMLLLFLACKKEEKIPTFSLEEVKYITHSTCIAEIFSTVDVPWYEYGLFLSTSGDPSIDNNILSEEMISGAKNNWYHIIGLESETTYFIRSYLKHRENQKIYYGPIKSFTTKSIEYFTDVRDQQVYPVVKIGEQHWMAANLNFANAENSWQTPNGRLYSLDAAQKAVPEGWHIPSDEEWFQLEKHLGMDESEFYQVLERGRQAYMLMQIGQHWLYSDDNTNETGFSAVPAGLYSKPSPGGYENITEQLGETWAAYYITASMEDEYRVWVRSLNYGRAGIYRNKLPANWGYSVRCVRDL
jgi:uncharacterized protein (TIGR02145 family)